MAETPSTTFIEPPTERKVYIPNDDNDSDIERFVSRRQESLSKPSETASEPAPPAATTPKRRAAPRKRAAQPAPIRIPDPERIPEPQEDKTDDVPALPSISSLRIEPNFSDSDSDSSSSDSEPPETPREHVYRSPSAPLPTKSRSRKQSKPPAPPADEQKPAQSPLAGLLSTGELDRATLISKICLYRSTFANKFSKSLMTKLKKVEVSCKHSDEELRSLHNESRLSVGASTSTALLLPLFGVVATVYEGIAVRIGVKCQGVASIMSQDPEINKILTEMSIEFLNVNYIPPHYRLMMYVLQATYVTHRANTILAQKAALQMQQTTQPAQTPVKPDQPIQPAEKYVAVKQEREDNVPDIDLDEIRKPQQPMNFNADKYKDL